MPDGLNRRALPPPTLATLYPPIRGYAYFDARASWPFAPQAPVDDARVAWWLAEHAMLAYDQPGAIAPVLQALGYCVEVIEHPASSSFAYAAIAADHGVLVFRGTEAMTPGDPLAKLGSVVRDWAVDASVRRVDGGHFGQVHGGFARALEGLWPRIETLLPRAAGWWCSGHSLGGALASLASIRLQLAGRLNGAVTFGQPALGDERTAAVLNQLPLLRVVNACDVVPQLPPALLGYRQSDRLRHLDAHRPQNYLSTVRKHLMRLPRNLRHGIGALTPIELIDHAPLHYVIKCFNAALADTS